MTNVSLAAGRRARSTSCSTAWTRACTSRPTVLVDRRQAGRLPVRHPVGPGDQQREARAGAAQRDVRAAWTHVVLGPLDAVGGPAHWRLGAAQLRQGSARPDRPRGPRRGAGPLPRRAGRGQGERDRLGAGRAERWRRRRATRPRWSSSEARGFARFADSGGRSADADRERGGCSCGSSVTGAWGAALTDRMRAGESPRPRPAGEESSRSFAPPDPGFPACPTLPR